MYLVHLTINVNVMYVSSISSMSNYKHECSVCSI